MATIGIFDSGVGGLSVFKEIKHLLPNENYVYYGDNANCPYGIKGAEFILARSMEITDFLISKGSEIIVIACNTATSYALDVLRENYNIPFIGTIPGIKPAVTKSKTGIIGVLATYGTLNAPLYKSIRDIWGKDVTILENVGNGFVELVESLEIEGENAMKVVRKSIQPMVENGADILVLGCTHYPFLSDVIKKVANELKPSTTPFVHVYDSAPAIARHLLNVVKDNNIELGKHPGRVELYSSGDCEVLTNLYKHFI